jgi:hypothetical protein
MRYYCLGKMVTCPNCGGLRTVGVSVKRSWWEKLLRRSEMAIETCKACNGIGSVRGTPEEEAVMELLRGPALRQRAAEDERKRDELRRRREESEQRRLAAGKGYRKCKCGINTFHAEDADDVCDVCRWSLKQKADEEQWKKSLAETIRSAYSGDYCHTCGALLRSWDDVGHEESPNDSQCTFMVCKRCRHRIACLSWRKY